MTTLQELHGVSRSTALALLAQTSVYGSEAETSITAYERIIEPLTADEARVIDLDVLGSDAIWSKFALDRTRIERAKTTAALEVLGIDPMNTDYVVIEPERVTAILFERDADGHRKLSITGEGYVRCKRTFNVYDTYDEEAGK